MQSVCIYKWILIWFCCNTLWSPSKICSRTSSIAININDFNQAIKFCKVYQIKLNTNFTQCTEMGIFKSKQKKSEDDLKIKLHSKGLYPIESVKYLGVKTDTKLVGNMLIIFPLN